ncbi:carbon-nitrogen hydrolase family protein (plasmid) [Streptomyces sp. NBC_00536]|uniref:carbon-nitrogen hydrolase family protein n=1 Tax=Streptomyces sp. NBC_00536 TaxID=2975769 RepID=UPI002E808CF3|nr:carbon-nitrogen hydrolase family protein [Streptomyces sp. NBC_00536]WUC84197.1 carbon-nitrogen hydrolase family protein [Streptomyces sp. NBC_00536]
MDDLHDLPSALPVEPLTVAAGQAACVALDVSANAATAAGLVRRAAAQGSDLLVLPELFLTGYELPGIVAAPATYALSPEDPRLDVLATACAETGTAVVVGAPAVDGGSGGLRISAFVFGRDGRFVVRYDKQHVTPGERAAGFTAGARGCTVSLDGWRLGLGICWDSGFPEHARAAALDGAHAYLVGAMFGRGGGERQLGTVFPARALDNTSYVVLANHSGPSGSYDGCGRSGVWGPDGMLLAEAGTEDPGLAVARLEPDVLARARAEDPVLVDPSLSAPVRARSSADV